MSSLRSSVGYKGQEWELKWVGRMVCQSSKKFKFMVYHCILQRMGIQRSFSSFQQRILRIFQVAPSQLHPNGWAFVKAFGVMMKAMKRQRSRKVFFTIYEVCRRKVP